jgi:hypothetical protein
VVFGAVRAKIAADRYQLAENARLAEEKEREAVQAQLIAEADN